MTALIPHPYPDGAAEAWIAAQARNHAAGREFTYAITSVDEPILVGTIGLRPAPEERGNLGFWIGRPYWGRGYATAAARAVIALAFALLDMDTVTARHLVRNPASGRVMEKCGMELRATETHLHRGAPEEFCLRAITREAWEGIVASG